MQKHLFVLINNNHAWEKITSSWGYFKSEVKKKSYLEKDMPTKQCQQ